MISLSRRISLWWKRFLERWLLGRPFGQLYSVLGGHIFFQSLNAAVRLDLFSILNREPGMTRQQVAARLKLQEKPVRILLLSCVSTGLLKKKGDGYFVTPLSRELLTRESPRNIESIIYWQDEINYRALQHFHEAIVANTNTGLSEFKGTEPTLYERLVHQPHLEKIFQDAMKAISVQANYLLSEYLDFSRFKHLVDVGGGNGTNVIALAKKNPGLKASVFDSPTVCELARANFKNAGLESRLSAVPGNCFVDAFPQGMDAFLFCHFMTIWSEERNTILLKKAYDALPSGGAAIIFNMMQRDDETGPPSAAMGSPYFLTLATGEGMLYTWSEYEKFMRDAGFARIERHVLVRDHGVIVGYKA